jgi:hypothetical protein
VEGCGGSIFVEDAVVIDAPLSANCKWQIKTDENRVLVFTVVSAGGNFKQVEEFLSVRILNIYCYVLCIGLQYVICSAVKFQIFAV